MKIALLGYGNMGREIERLVAASHKHSIIYIGLEHAGDEIDNTKLAKADVIIDFTSPEIVVENIRKAATLNLNIVVGTTGWYERIKEVEKLVKKNNIGLIYAQNFSIGANIFFKIVSYSAQLMAKFGSYDVFGFEVHHTGKKDSPSGTALRIAREIMKNFPAKKTLRTERLDRQIMPNELHLASIRGGRNPGFHQVTFDSSADSITLSHSAHNREGFAQGALLAAEFIFRKKGFFVFDEIFKEEEVRK